MNTIFSRMRFAAAAVLFVSTFSLSAGEPSVDRWGDPLPEQAVARLGTLRFRVEQDPHSLAFSPDGNLLAAAAHDGIAFVFDARTGRRLRTIDMVAEVEPGRLRRAVYAVCFSPDGKQLALAGANGQIHSHDVQTGRRVEVLSVRPEIAEILDTHRASVRFSQDGKLIAAQYWMKDPLGGSPGCVVFENATQRDVFRMTFSVTPCADGRFLALKLGGDEEGIRDVQVLDLRTGKLLGKVLDCAGYVPLGLSRDGTFMVALRLPPPSVEGIGSFLSQEIALVDVASGEVRATLIAPEDERFRRDLAFTLDGRFLMTTSHQTKDGTFYNSLNRIQLWDVATGRQIWSRSIPGSSSPLPSAFSLDGRRIALGFSNDTRIRLLSLKTGDEIETEESGHDCGVSTIAASPDGHSVVTGDWSHCAMVWDARTGQMQRVLAPEYPAYSVVWSPDAELLATAHKDRVDAGMMARLWHAPSGRAQHTLDHGAFDVWDLEFAPRGRRLVTVGYDEAARSTRLTTWNTETGRSLETITSPGEADKSRGLGKELALSPTGELAVDGLSGAVRAWSLRHPGATASFPGQFEGVRDIRFSTDGTLLSSVDRKDAIRIWEVASGEILTDLPPTKHGRGTVAAAFSPDGRMIASAEDAETSLRGEGRFHILIRELPTRRELARLTGHTSRVRALAFTPDGSRLFSGHSNGTTLVWDVADLRLADASDTSERTTTSNAELWQRLAEPNAGRAVKAMDELASRGADSVRFLGDLLQPTETPAEATVSKLIRQLSDDDFDLRKEANGRLRAFGRVVEPQLRAAVAESPSAELRGRCERLLKDCESPFTTQPSRLREIRAVQVLARIGSPEVMRLIEKLSRGAAGAEQTETARAVLRLGK